MIIKKVGGMPVSKDAVDLTTLNLKQENLDLKNLKQFKFANLKYDDSMFNNTLHTIRTNKIEQVNYDIEEYLPKSIIDKYKDC